MSATKCVSILNAVPFIQYPFEFAKGECGFFRPTLGAGSVAPTTRAYALQLRSGRQSWKNPKEPLKRPFRLKIARNRVETFQNSMPKLPALVLTFAKHASISTSVLKHLDLNFWWPPFCVQKHTGKRAPKYLCQFLDLDFLGSDYPVLSRNSYPVRFFFVLWAPRTRPSIAIVTFLDPEYCDCDCELLRSCTLFGLLSCSAVPVPSA